jgi:glucuronate isomerase
MLTEMAQMSLEDGLTMQIHPGSVRNHNRKVYERYGRDMGADIPRPPTSCTPCAPCSTASATRANSPSSSSCSTSRPSAANWLPLAGHYPCLRLGPPWWFHDSPEGMMRFRQQATETAGFYNTVGFNDDTRAFLSIPARHDVARRIDCAFLANLVAQHRLEEDEAFELAHELTYSLVKKAYKL